MAAQLIDGKALASKMLAAIKTRIQEKAKKGHRPPGLAVIVVGEDPASLIYVRNKRFACEEVGINSFYCPLPANVPEAELASLIQKLNHDSEVDGILLQSPLPKGTNEARIFEMIDPKKDVDGFHPYNIGRLAQRRPLLRPCTPYGIMLLLDHIKQALKGKHAVVVGASNIVGRPMALELLIAGSTVTICHRFTTDLSAYVKQADVLISAVGRPGLIKGEWAKSGAVLIDVGQNRLPDGKIIGDIEFGPACERAAWITPVPGGVGPMTVAVLLHNALLTANYLDTPLDFGLK